MALKMNENIVFQAKRMEISEGKNQSMFLTKKVNKGNVPRVHSRVNVHCEYVCLSTYEYICLSAHVKHFGIPQISQQVLST